MPKSVLRYEMNKVRYLHLESYLIRLVLPNKEPDGRDRVKFKDNRKWSKKSHRWDYGLPGIIIVALVGFEGEIRLEVDKWDCYLIPNSSAAIF